MTKYKNPRHLRGNLEEYAMICEYCDKPAVLTLGALVFPHRSELSRKMYYLCEPCDAMVGCHPNSTKPLGRMANKKLRQSRYAAHQAFDPIWQGCYMSRTKAYKWLAEALGIHKAKCHIGLFNVNTCRRTVILADAYMHAKRSRALDSLAGR